MHATICIQHEELKQILLDHINSEIDPTRGVAKYSMEFLLHGSPTPLPAIDGTNIWLVVVFEGEL